MATILYVSNECDANRVNVSQRFIIQINWNMHIPHNFEIEGVRTLHDDVQRMTIYVYSARILKQYSYTKPTRRLYLHELQLV